MKRSKQRNIFKSIKPFLNFTESNEQLLIFLYTINFFLFLLIFTRISRHIRAIYAIFHQSVNRQNQFFFFFFNFPCFRGVIFFVQIKQITVQKILLAHFSRFLMHSYIFKMFNTPNPTTLSLSLTNDNLQPCFMPIWTRIRYDLLLIGHSEPLNRWVYVNCVLSNYFEFKPLALSRKLQRVQGACLLVDQFISFTQQLLPFRIFKNNVIFFQTPCRNTIVIISLSS